MKSTHEVKTAIFPVAGFGTRFLPATKAQPKEMLPVVDKPAIQYLVEDAVGAGIKEVIFVTGRGKRAIEDHFDYSFELDRNLVEKNKISLVKEVRQISNLAKFSYVRQQMPLGDGHAISCAGHLVHNEAILVMFGDTLYDAEVSPAKQVIDAYKKYGKTIVGLARVPRDKVSEFGVIDGKQLAERVWHIKDFVEKPAIEEAPSELVAVGVYVITPEVIEVLSRMKTGKSGEIRLADAFGLMLSEGKEIIGLELVGDWLDTGNKLGWLKANVQLALKNKTLGPDLKKYLDSLDKS